jgi:hypothetical protein
MQIQRAFIVDQDLTFLVVAVPQPVLDNRTKAKQTVRLLQARLDGLPVALVTRDTHGAPTAYYGRSDLAVRLLRRQSTPMAWADVPMR